jgi:hypothetical protein
MRRSTSTILMLEPNMQPSRLEEREPKKGRIFGLLLEH